MAHAHRLDLIRRKETKLNLLNSLERSARVSEIESHDCGTLSITLAFPIYTFHFTREMPRRMNVDTPPAYVSETACSRGYIDVSCCDYDVLYINTFSSERLNSRFRGR